MMYYSRLRMASVIGICLVGLALCLPNVISQPMASLPWRQIHLGLDLRGGSYLLLQVDMNSVAADRLRGLQDETRQTLLKNSLGYRNLATTAHGVTFTPRTPDETQPDLKALRAMPMNVPGEFTVEPGDGGQINLTLSADAARQRAYDAVTQSIEIVRRRIDATGAIDPEITRQGEDRIIVELPGISDPERVKNLLGTTAKMTFHLVADSAIGSAVPPPGVDLLPMSDGQSKLPVFSHVDVDGADLTNASASIDQQSGEWAVNFTFDSTGAQEFGDVTRANVASASPSCWITR